MIAIQTEHRDKRNTYDVLLTSFGYPGKPFLFNRHVQATPLRSPLFVEIVELFVVTSSVIISQVCCNERRGKCRDSYMVYV